MEGRQTDGNKRRNKQFIKKGIKWKKGWTPHKWIEDGRRKENLMRREIKKELNEDLSEEYTNA